MIRSFPLRVLLGLSAWFVVASAARAEASSSLPAMTLDQALAYAATHNPRLLVDTQDVEAQRKAAAVPGKRWLPKVGVTAQVVGGSNNNSAAIWLSSRGALEFPRIAGTAFLQKPGEINWKPYVNTAVGIGFEQEIFDFGRIAAEQAVADARLAATKEGAQADQLDVVLGVREAFFAVQAAHQVRTAADEAVQRATVHRDAICSLAKEGLRPTVDCERGQADLARYQAALSRADGSLASARVTFAASMGYEQEEVDVAGPPPPMSNQLPSFAKTVAQAEAREPRLRAAGAYARESRAEAAQSKAALRPQIYGIGTMMGSAGGAPPEGGSHGTYGRGAIPFIPDYYAGLVFAWRMLDAPGRAQREAALATAKTDERRIGEVRERTRTEAAQAWVAADSAMRTLPELEQALRAAEINYAKVDGRYSEGLGNIIELADAEALRVDAQINLAVGHFDFSRSMARLDRALAKESRP